MSTLEILLVIALIPFIILGIATILYMIIIGITVFVLFLSAIMQTIISLFRRK